jgi:hypothetical protein
MRGFLTLATIFTLALATGCATRATGPSLYDFFGSPGSSDDVWYDQVTAWQHRALTEETASATLPPVAASNERLLAEEIAGFQTSSRRDLAKLINEWSQRRAIRYYRKERGESFDSDDWPTYDELLSRNGDDCDGVDLIAYTLLHYFGFPRDTVYRSIMTRDADGVNHMVTLWFEDPQDPWVLDATRAMSREMRRMSALVSSGWRPLKVFNETDQFRVVELDAPATVLAGE